LINSHQLIISNFQFLFPIPKVNQVEEIYEPLNKSLELVGALMSAAETHGILCGLLCTSQPFSLDVWLRHVLAETAVEDGLASECQQQLAMVKDYTFTQLNSPQCEFTLLLPDDDVSLMERTQAIGGWCEGFLFGLGLINVETESLTDEAKEFVNDVIAISRIAPPEDSNDLEEDYMQVVEYLKVGVINLYEELSHKDEAEC
jgi:yecA family protein